MRRALHFARLLGLAGLLALSGGAQAADKKFVAGAYCPLPEKGEVPRCLGAAEDAYGEFFTALDGGVEAAEEGALRPVEAAVAEGAGGEQAYLALSSLTHGYFRLAERAAKSEATDPELVARLARWNDLLARAYSGSEGDSEYRAAVRQAAEELNERTRVSLPCRGPQGEPSDCNSTEDVLRGFNAASDRVGIRGALERVIERFFGGDES